MHSPTSRCRIPPHVQLLFGRPLPGGQGLTSLGGRKNRTQSQGSRCRRNQLPLISGPKPHNTGKYGGGGGGVLLAILGQRRPEVLPLYDIVVLCFRPIFKQENRGLGRYSQPWSSDGLTFFLLLHDNCVSVLFDFRANTTPVIVATI